MDNFRQRLCFCAPTDSDVLLDRERKNQFQDLIVFFGTDKIGNMVLLCINQNHNFKQSNSLIYIRDHNGLEFTNKESNNGFYEFSSWKTSSLQFQCIVPMQTWRIVFSGRMSNRGNNHHVKIHLLWKPFGFPVYCDKNNMFFKNEIDDVDENITRHLLGFDQFGRISGVVVVDGKTETTINTRAIKLRRWNMSTDDTVFFGITDSCSVCSVQKLDRLIYCRGHLKTSSEHEILTDSDIDFSRAENDNPIISIQRRSINFDLNTNVKNRSLPVVLNGILSIKTVFGDDFRGILLCFREPQKNNVKPKFGQMSAKIDADFNSIVNLDSEVCKRSDIVGNKAKSLHLLKKAISEGLIKQAVVPNGICVTAFALKNHINENENLLNDLYGAIEIAKKNDFGKLSDYCERLKNRWLSSKIDARLLAALSNNGVLKPGGVYAVRSSGTFEDGESTSSAGQYVTKLGCAGRLDEVTAAILECWSSNFSARALTYRRNNGQPLMGDMAVVVQVQVNGQVAGVAFTRDPNTGDPEKITIAATHGPGEGVVSGSVEADTVVMSRQQLLATVDDDSIVTNIGDLITTQSFGVKNDECNARLRTSDDLMKNLAKLCVQVEDVFGSPQDIEWAADEDRIYLLQSRPITSIFAWNNDEIAREFDTPFMDDDVAMFYNVKEVYPNPVHPLSLTLDFFSAYPLFKIIEGEPTDIYRSKQLCYTHYNLCLNVCQMFQDLEPSSVYVNIIEYSIAGKSFLTSDIWEKILLKNRSSALKKFLKSISTFKEILYLESRLVEIHRLICGVNLNQSDSVLDLLNKIDGAVDVLEKVTFCHMASSSNNIVSHTLLATLGIGFNKDSKIETLSDLASSVHTPDIINVSILNDIQAITSVISEMPTKKEFCDLPVENCYDWLKYNCQKAYGQVEDFLNKYGHRGVQELDFGSETWSSDPTRLFSCLQSLILSDRRQSPEKPTDSDSSEVDNRGYIKKMLFDYLLKRYRQSISYREQSKDMLVQITQKLRLGYLKLGDKLVENGKIPDSKLIFFMSQYEVRNICDQNYPEIVHKATKRRKLWPTLGSLQFDDVCCGPPVPITNYTDVESINSSIQLNGCCVFPGRVKNRACVLEHIEDAHCLRAGDILIVKSIDIAWSPYFPIISGLVTEIGGIISHGAVVAREYGLPCLVGVRNAKKHFKTGDTIILDSEKGFVIKDVMTNH
ncbi:ATP-grasp fold, subdomain 1,PEP-utilising enzyme, mobile domain,Pyruvate phosphate dikinase [Cinara cedri]|uniref:ATP-grasp fold, subdomain 1,PEP-utilising enzyme, mobile domain,Pyruvate phosphate dikinase n=1 Tax=Cinara cedri TaxID=506608 RepID=A0A5E4NQV0_9HEMI|nr:ATP-grasp fold, subdomain 1,PEP-utilising enzyme, mobile domain,Pyruvate phosphate dikinase [Cinara cedri]